MSLEGESISVLQTWAHSVGEFWDDRLALPWALMQMPGEVRHGQVDLANRLDGRVNKPVG